MHVLKRGNLEKSAFETNYLISVFIIPVFSIRLSVHSLMVTFFYLVGVNPNSQSKSSAGATPSPPQTPPSLLTPLYAVKHIYYWRWKSHKDTFVYHQRDHLCSTGSLLWKTTHTQAATENPSHRVVSTYHTPRLQRCIQRMPPTKGTHHWLHSSQRVETHTCHPGKRKGGEQN